MSEIVMHVVFVLFYSFDGYAVRLVRDTVLERIE